MNTPFVLRKSLLFYGFLLCAAIPAVAQQPATAAPPLPTYDIVSIHPNNSLSGSMRISTNPGILSFTNVTLKQMLAYAYGIRDGLIEGLPGWAESAHFDLSAKVLDPDLGVLKNMTREQRSAMVIPILADRFDAKVHIETKTQPVFDLVIAKGAPKLKEYVPPAGDPPAKGPNLGAGSINIHNFGSSLDMTAIGTPMSSFVEVLSRQVDKTVIDKTGIAGKYDFELKFTPDNARMNGAAVETTDQAPDIYTALQEQLGLKLVASKGPVATLVVDQIKQPTAN